MDKLALLNAPTRSRCASVWLESSLDEENMFGLFAICANAWATALFSTLSLKVRGGGLLERASERGWVTALAEPERAGRLAQMFEVQFSVARIERVSATSGGEA